MEQEQRESLVWYAAYGSNLSFKRFKRYLAKCRNDSEPIKNKPIIIPHQLYFAKSSEKWKNKGVAFIKSKVTDSRDNQTKGRIYLITKEQFNDIFHQENSKNKYNIFNINYEQIIREQQIIVPGTGWYTRIIYLGTEEEYPIFTFTSPISDNQIEKNLPSITYQSYIISGLKETYPSMNMKSICNYLYKMGGKNCYEKEVKTIKDHDCSLCGQPIPKGEIVIVHRYFVGWRRTVSNYYHKKCKP
jgi:hypothetical protein